jgi:hypothetical protein
LLGALLGFFTKNTTPSSYTDQARHVAGLNYKPSSLLASTSHVRLNKQQHSWHGTHVNKSDCSPSLNILLQLLIGLALLVVPPFSSSSTLFKISKNFTSNACILMIPGLSYHFLGNSCIPVVVVVGGGHLT